MLFTNVPHKRAQRAFKKAGFRVVHEGKHTVMSDGTRYLVIPRHDSLNPYTLRAIIQAAGLTDEQFKDLL
jgi:predicted RNA binding protein YcfA (HicA-like mRNA interferase family)